MIEKEIPKWETVVLYVACTVGLGALLGMGLIHAITQCWHC